MKRLTAATAILSSVHRHQHSTTLVVGLAIVMQASVALAQLGGGVPTPSQVVNAGERLVHVYNVDSKHAEEIGRLLMQVFASKDVQVAVDTRLGTLIVSGPEKEQARVAETLKMLLENYARTQEIEKARAREQSQSLLVRVLWFTTIDEPAAELPADLAEVTAAIRPHVAPRHLTLASQMMVNVEPSNEFTAQGQSAATEPTMLRVEGDLTLTEESEARVRISLAADAQQEPKADLAPRRRQLFDVRTSITAPQGHMVVLGMVPSGKQTEVLVVQVLRPQDLLTKKKPEPTRAKN